MNIYKLLKLINELWDLNNQSLGQKYIYSNGKNSFVVYFLQEKKLNYGWSVGW